MVKAFLEASAKGHLFARHHPREAADALVDLAREECPDLPDPLEREMVRESMEVLAEVSCGLVAPWGALEVLAEVSRGLGPGPPPATRTIPHCGSSGMLSVQWRCVVVRGIDSLDPF